MSVVGTNGKGTVTNMMATGLSHSGLVTGRFLSPHVESFQERVTVDGEAVSGERIGAFVASAQRLIERDPELVDELRPAFFEYTLALALSEFAHAGAQAAVLEAGVGGGGDATRAVEPVQLTVITNVDLDHLDVLGPTLLDVALDKAGAIRDSALVVSGVTQPEVRRLLRRVADEVGAELHQLESGEEELFALPTRLEPPLGGGVLGSSGFSPTRLANARMAAAGLRLLGLAETAVEAGLLAAPLPGRGERFSLPTDSGLVSVLLDGAHDAAAARHLRAELAKEDGAGYVLLFGALVRKQQHNCLPLLASDARAVFLTDAAEARWGGGEAISWPGARYEPAAEAALDAALSAAASLGATLVISGSLYLAGRVRPLLRERGQRVPASWEALRTG